MVRCNLRIVTRVDVQHTPNLEHIANQIALQRNMRHPSSQDLEASFERGLAAVALDADLGDRPAGYVRIFPKTALMNGGSPALFEIGGGFMVKEHRAKGHHHYADLRNALLGLYEGRINRGEMLVVGISNSYEVRGVLARSADVGVGHGHMTNGEFHMLYPSVAPIFCNCRPEMGDNMDLVVTYPGCPVERCSAESAALRDYSISRMSGGEGKMPEYMVYWHGDVPLGGNAAVAEDHGSLAAFSSALDDRLGHVPGAGASAQDLCIAALRREGHFASL